MIPPRIGIDGVGKLRFRLGAIDGGVRSGVQNHMRRGLRNAGTKLRGVGQVDRVAANCGDGTGSGKAGPERAPKLAGSTKNEDATG